MNLASTLAPLSVMYGLVMRARSALYRSGLLTVHRIEAPVISVGNITAGGTGKTPLVAWIARAVARDGYRVCILTRGYGRSDVSKRVVVSDEERLLADAREGGDEPRLLAEMLQSTASVISDRNRVEAARWAMKNLGSEVFILDDGFQHLRIARDLNIVTVDGTNAWGGGRLLPQGRLREPKQALARADCCIITRADLAQEIDALRSEILNLSSPNIPIFVSRMQTTELRPLSPTHKFSELLKQHSSDQPFAAFCALGNPQSFFDHLQKDGYILALTHTFPDHHFYTQNDIDALSHKAEQSGAQALLTTAKDAVKLRALQFRLPCFIVDIEMQFDDEAKLLKLIHHAISQD